ncbi:MAG TPA: hypothetical protein VFB16_00255 [Bauldia sp.]|nr:hypothetical protein [Bauldia sp.]
MTVSADSDQEAPLDPAMERVQRKLRRLMLIGGLTLGIGLLAVMGAIVYRLFAVTGGPPAPAPNAAVLVGSASIPAGSRLVASAVDGNRAVLTYEREGATAIVIVDLRSLTVTGRMDLKPE